MQHAAVRLFADRAAAVSPAFRVDDANVGSVVEIVRRLDGLPLAIELAAARLRNLPVTEIAARLNDRFRLLTGGSRTALPRHRTLRAVVEWSWDLLSPPERLLVERFAVFPAGATPQSAEAVCADRDADSDTVAPADVLDLLASLVDKSLLQESSQSAQSAQSVQSVPTGVRYRMLETIREYGHDRMFERGELTRIRDAHARYFADLVRESDPHLRRPEQLVWMTRLNTERENILAALRHLGERGDAQAALEMAVSMGWYWSLLGSHAEALNWITFALDVPGPADPQIRLLGEAIQIMNSASSPGLVSMEDVDTGMQRLGDLSARLDQIDTAEQPILALMKPIMAMFANDADRVSRLVEEAMSSPDPWVAAAARALRAAVAENNGDVAKMRIDAEQAVREFRDLGERWGLANSLQMLGQLKTVDGDIDAAIACFEESLAMVVEMGARQDEAMMHVRLADLHMRKGDMRAARVHVQNGFEISEAAGSTLESMFAGAVLAECARLAGDLPEARRLRDESMRRFAEIPPTHPIQGHGKALILAIAAKQDLADGAVDAARDTLIQAVESAAGTKDMPIVAAVGVAVADLALRTGLPEQAAQMLGAAARLRGAEDATQLDVKRITAALREQCGDERFHAAYEQGRALDREAAIARLDPTTLP